VKNENGQYTQMQMKFGGEEGEMFLREARGGLNYMEDNVETGNQTINLPPVFLILLGYICKSPIKPPLFSIANLNGRRGSGTSAMTCSSKCIITLPLLF
jgi:hypothetical protein